MKTIKEFDYDLWAVDVEGKKQYFCRAKATGEECEISLECMRVLLAEEKAMRRRIARDTDRLLSLGYSTSDEHGEEWIIDRDDFVEDIIASEIEGAFISTLTECQKSIYIHCMKPNISVREYSRLSGLAVTTIQNHIEAVRKNIKNISCDTEQKRKKCPLSGER